MTATLIAEKPSPVGSRGRWIEHWEPEDEQFWASVGRKTARRNLIFSILAEHVGFSVWVIWSVLVVALGTANPEGFPFLKAVPANADKIFWLVALPNLIGAFMRFPYTVLVARFGGRNWTVISSLLLAIPVSLAIYGVTHPGTPYWFFLLAAMTAGFGGGNFASSMANISYFYPERSKGTALGLNAAGGNIGISSMQLIVPLFVAFLGLSVVTAATLWLPLVLISAVCAFLFMDNLHVAKATMREQFAAVRRPHAWIMSFIYIGTFGSFLGLSAAFPAVLKFIFQAEQTLHFLGTSLVLPLAFLGPLVGSLTRPFGGWLADRVGGAKITAAVFTLMTLGTFGAIAAAGQKNLAMFLTSMMLLFAMSGAGNGSLFRMIPAIFRKQADAEIAATGAERGAVVLRARREGAATLGMAGAIGAMGGFILPKVIGNSIQATGGLTVAFSWFAVMYVVCLIVTVGVYLRPGSPLKGV